MLDFIKKNDSCELSPFYYELFYLYENLKELTHDLKLICERRM